MAKHNIITQAEYAAKKAARAELKNTDSSNINSTPALREREDLIEKVVGIK